MTKKTFLVLIFLWAGAQASRAQEITQDWKLHNAGQVIQIVQNQGHLNQTHSDYPGLLNTEFPPNSFQEHTGSIGPFFGGIVQKPSGPDTLVSTAERLGGGETGHVFEGYSDQPFDTVWVAQRGDALDIPYPVPYPSGRLYVPGRDSGYLPVSTQDFVTRYNDYNEASQQISDHDPMFLDVTQTSYAYGSEPLNKVIIINYALTPTEYPIEDLYVGIFNDGNVGSRTGAGFVFAQDDYAQYYGREDDQYDFHMGATFDAPGSQADDGKYPPIGNMLIPSDEMQEELPEDSAWTWVQRSRFSQVLPPSSNDGAVYEEMASHLISPDQPQALNNWTLQFQTVGPSGPLAVGDTARFSVALVLGEDEEDMLQNASAVQSAAERDFQLPRAPPVPDLAVEADNKQVTLDWSGDANAVENFVDTNRTTKPQRAFEGYRVWKSTQTAQGPWTLLAQYDKDENAYGPNAGLQPPPGDRGPSCGESNRCYVDEGLVNNVEHFYAVTAYSKSDTLSEGVIWPSQSTSRNATAQTIVPGTGPQDRVDSVAVVPNPYRGDVRYQDYNPPWEKPPGTRERWLEQDRRLQFINLPEQARIKIYTLDGVHVQTLRHSSTRRGFEDWDMISRAGQAIASGIYLYTVENLANGNATTGKFVVIK